MLFSSKGGPSWIVAFLGNPGLKYEGTRHNAGFMTADALCKKKNIAINKSRFQALIAQTELGGEKVLLMKPQTYMNLSGQAISQAARFYKIPPEHVLVVSDEIALIGNRFYVKATATLSTGPHEQVSATAFAREEESKKGMDAAQLTGATSSYARKYALNGLFAIDDNKDADATNTHGKEPSAGRKFTAEEAAAAERWADGLDRRAFVATLAEMRIQSLLELDYSRKAEFMRICKENAAELKELDAAQDEDGEK